MFYFRRLYEVPKNGQKNDGGVTDNIFSWVHKEFKTNDINASKHRLLCKLDDMSNGKKKKIKNFKIKFRFFFSLPISTNYTKCFMS